MCDHQTYLWTVLFVLLSIFVWYIYMYTTWLHNINIYNVPCFKKLYILNGANFKSYLHFVTRSDQYNRYYGVGSKFEWALRKTSTWAVGSSFSSCQSSQYRFTWKRKTPSISQMRLIQGDHNNILFSIAINILFFCNLARTEFYNWVLKEKVQPT